IGLTGGVASGKSVVTRFFRDVGSPTIDTDLVAREVVEYGRPGLVAVRQAFGEAILTPDGRLDRRKLRSIIFADESKRRELNAILHPLIRRRVLEQVDALAARGDVPYVIIAVPLLVETNFGELVDRVLVVDCEPETQLARLMARDGMTETEARAMIAAQVDRETRLAAADDVIDNSGSLEDTQRQVQRLHERYRQLATV
ncbi:MAG: dephospho-CoA kinase, partial [Gammaproteobacteria bacterium]|nr:dephospho-CoA kinase [Gammaproteobacteria bacterium]